MVREIAGEMDIETNEALANTRDYFKSALPGGDYVCLLAEAGGEVVGVGGMVLFRKPSQPLSPVGMEGYILNMLTMREWRGKGIASSIMQGLLDCAREAGAGLVWLRATDAGRRVYERFGFAEYPRYMQVKL
jgi:GNAT superfamily N-acetyltransferase